MKKKDGNSWEEEVGVGGRKIGKWRLKHIPIGKHVIMKSIIMLLKYLKREKNQENN